MAYRHKGQRLNYNEPFDQRLDVWAGQNGGHAVVAIERARLAMALLYDMLGDGGAHAARVWLT